MFSSKYKQDITIGGTVVDCSSQVRDMGVIFDGVLSLRQHVSYTSKTCRFHFRNISRIRKYIPQDTSVILVKSLVMSRLTILMVCCMDSLNVLFLVCKRYKTQLLVL